MMLLWYIYQGKKVKTGALTHLSSHALFASVVGGEIFICRQVTCALKILWQAEIAGAHF
jgi:hypothetical protein